MNFNTYVKAFNQHPPSILQGHSTLFVLQELSNGIAHLSNASDSESMRKRFEILFGNVIMTAGYFNWEHVGATFLPWSGPENVALNEMCALFNLALSHTIDAVLSDRPPHENFSLFINTLCSQAHVLFGKDFNTQIEAVLDKQLHLIVSRTTLTH